MTDRRWARIQSIFAGAVKLPAGERDAYLDEACAGDEVLRREVASLLESDASTQPLLDGPALGEQLREAVSGEPDRAPRDMTDRRIGPYRILAPIAEGGMGAVYLAARDDGQFEQRVALKLLRSSMPSAEMQKRFAEERQILARLAHPGIARLLDGGVTDDGLPWFAMEYVDGQPMDEWCDKERLSIEERIRLFIDACDALRYAHARLVIHRDLKPDNILVSLDDDGRPRVKLLDFGIAKLLQDERDGLTRTSGPPMTPAYASPEQVRGQPVSTATDVYSLGVLLYELLTGVRPYEISSTSPAEIAQVIGSTQPPRPSTAARTAAADAGQARRVRPEILGRRLEGDLDVICLKALRKEPERRYTSVEGLQDDLRRHLEGLPVTARPDTLGYRVGKFVSRNRSGLTAAAVVVLAVSGLTGFYTVQLQAERDRARTEAETSEQVVTFMEELFESIEPGEALGETVTVREVVDSGAVRLRSELADQPAVRARLLDVLGGVYAALFMNEAADTLLTEAAGDWRRLGEDGRLGLSETLNKHGSVKGVLMQQDSAISMYEEALAIRRATLGEDHPDVAELMNNLALIYLQEGEFARAEELLTEAIAMEERLLEDPAEYSGAMRYNLAYLVSYRGDYDEAIELYMEALELLRAKHGEYHPNPMAVLQALSDLYADRGELVAADTLLQAAMEVSAQVMGEESVDYAFGLSDLGRIRAEQGRFDEAEELQFRAIALMRRNFPDGHPYVASVVETLGLDYYRAERWDDAVERLQEAYDLRRQFLAPPHPDLSNNLGNLALVLRMSGDMERAEDMYREVLAMDRELYGEEHREIATVLHNIALIYVDRQDWATADSLHQEALAMRRRIFEGPHIHLAISLNSLGVMEESRGDLATAVRYLAEAYEVRLAARDGDETRPDVIRARERLEAVRERMSDAGDDGA